MVLVFLVGSLKRWESSKTGDKNPSRRTRQSFEEGPAASELSHETQ